MNKIIVEKIREARIERELTQKQVAYTLGYKTGNAISEIERGNAQISAADLFKLSDLFNKPLQYFYGQDFGLKTTEDMIAIFNQLSVAEQEQVKSFAISLSSIKSFEKETEAFPEKYSEREKLETLYNFILQQMLPMSKQFAALNLLKEQLEIDLGLTLDNNNSLKG